MAKKRPKNKGKQVANKTALVEEKPTEPFVASQCATPPLLPVFLKVCRLCESKDGPFLNIFDAEKVTAKKIDELMPFSITENDDLPHKICFRCSAKLEELYEFIQRCIRTQESLRKVVGTYNPVSDKVKMGKKLWEEKLTKTNLTNDDICDALIKKAMEGIKGIPTKLPVVPEPVESKRVTRSKESTATKSEIMSEIKSDDADELPLKQVKMSLEKNETKPPSNKNTRSSKSDTTKTEPATSKKTRKVEVQPKNVEAAQSNMSDVPQANSNPDQKKSEPSLNNFSFDYDKPTPPVPKETNSEKEQNEEPKKPFNIMDYISMIKVNGVGVLFQCKLCNRNFLKKEVVESHNCAKKGVAKVDVPKSVPVPEPPKVPSVKYIKIDDDMKKSLTEKVRNIEKSENEKNSIIDNDVVQEISHASPPKVKSKPKAGPASKTKRNLFNVDSDGAHTSSVQPNPKPVAPQQSAAPIVSFPTLPNLNGRFKLVPGPNNIFTLVEDTSAPVQAQPATVTEDVKKSSRKRKSYENDTEQKSKERKIRDNSSPEIIDLEDQVAPYPVGLFQTNVAHTEQLYDSPVAEAPPPFTTPAMKKQSYTIVQTGNPSKLLISTKAKAVESEAPKKRQKKSKPEAKDSNEDKEPFRVTLEDVAPPKDTGFFTFINVDPLLQPSYVLPTDNIIQESQISTSSSISLKPESKDKEKTTYNCNMCGESFSREKKLLSHIQSHYTKMDEEDMVRADKSSKKRSRK